MFDRILLPLDRSSLAECVLPHAVALAHTFESHVTLVHVMDPLRQANWRRAMDPLNWQIRKAEAKSYLQAQALRLAHAGVAADIQILEGPAAEQVVEFAHKNAIQFCLLSSHGQSGLSGWNVSSVVQKISQRIWTSVMVVRAYHPSTQEVTGLHYRRILVPMDGSQRAEWVLPVATTLARVHDAEIVLAHIVQRPEIPRRTPPTREDIELAERLVDRNQTEAIHYLDELRAQFSGETQTRVIVSDQVVAALHEMIEQEKVDLVLLNAHGSSGQTRWQYGGVVNNFMMYGTTPLLIMQDTIQNQTEHTPAEVAASEHGRP
jgi:nucleotide-binding universal stress UspA family protein